MITYKKIGKIIMAWSTYIEQNQNRFIDELKTFISIPSVSASDEHFQDVVKAGEWVSSKLQSIGISNARLMKTDTHPVVYGDWLHAGDDKPTVLIYGHFDVQPADPYELWDMFTGRSTGSHTVPPEWWMPGAM